MKMGGVCSVCGREARGMHYHPPYHVTNGREGAACSMRCLNLVWESKGMIDPTPNERDAMIAGGQQGGEYLDSLGKTDLADLAPDEWATFLEAVVAGYTDRLRELARSDQDRIKEHAQASDGALPLA